MVRIGVFGVGAFGFAILKYLDNQNKHFIKKITAYDANTDIMMNLNEHTEHPFFCHGVKLSERISYAKDPQDLIENSDMLFIIVGSSAIPAIIDAINKSEKKNLMIINFSKGLDHHNGKRFSEVYEESLKQKYKYATFAGGTIACELLGNNQLGADIASKDKDLLDTLSNILSSETLKIYKKEDVTGVEYASALKNVVSLFAGLMQGLNYPLSTTTFFLSRAAQEAKQFAVSKGANPETFSFGSQCWGNDLWMTAFGDTRSKKFGMSVGSGKEMNVTFSEFQKKHLLVEGIYTLSTIADHHGLDNYPVLNAIKTIFLDSGTPSVVIEELKKKKF